jgi:hypothetical protein
LQCEIAVLHCNLEKHLFEVLVASASCAPLACGCQAQVFPRPLSIVRHGANSNELAGNDFAGIALVYQVLTYRPAGELLRLFKRARMGLFPASGHAVPIGALRAPRRGRGHKEVARSAIPGARVRGPYQGASWPVATLRPLGNAPTPALPEISHKALTVRAPLVVAWRVAARSPVVDSDLTPGRTAIPVLVAAVVLTMRQSLGLLWRSSRLLRGLSRTRDRDAQLRLPLPDAVQNVSFGAQSVSNAYGIGSRSKRRDMAAFLVSVSGNWRIDHVGIGSAACRSPSAS